MSQDAERQCPVCGVTQPIENQVCANPDCPWEFVAVLGTAAAAQALLEQRLAEARAQWQRRVAARQAVLGQARRAAEAICRRVFAQEIGQPGTMTLEELIETLQAKQIIPPHVVMSLRTIQSYGNFALHPEEELIELPGEWGAPGLYALAHVTNWYVADYPGVALSEAVANQQPNRIAGRYQDLGDGTVLDTKTSLQWMRCAMGQMWDGTTCVGGASEFKWNEMFERVMALNGGGGFAGHRDWRVPTIDELKTLLLKNKKPAIDQQAFPLDRISVRVFWSSSPYAGSSGYAWYVYFDNGSVSSHGKDYTKDVRLVRGGQ